MGETQVVAVTGGAGYIGSHVVRSLNDAGHTVVVIDVVKPTRVQANTVYVTQDLSETSAVENISQMFQEHSVQSVIHLAARKQVGESVEKPLWYYEQNIVGLMNLVKAVHVAGVDEIVLSSSATVYESQGMNALVEGGPVTNNNPYGETKLANEWLLGALGNATGLKHVSLRYFNVAGAGADELCDPHALNLIPIVFGQMDRGETPKIFGDDYDTPDGTCIRDYIHVSDLAEAHVAALHYLTSRQYKETVFNVGTGSGSSVKEVISEIHRVTGIDPQAEIVARRAGDPPTLIASVDLIQQKLGWKARHSLSEIVSSAWSAHRAMHDSSN